MDQPAPSPPGGSPERSGLLRVGLVGCGFQGTALAKAVTGITALRLAACADPDPAAAAGVAALAEAVSSHPSVEALLDRAAVDAVLVATPHHLLCPVTLAEKPIGLNEQEAAMIEREAARAGVRYMPGYSLRFWLARHVRDLLAANTV